jgi:flagellar protein FlgJ
MNITLGLQSAIVPDKGAAQHAKLVDAAQQFEGVLLQEMLKGMQSGKDGEDGDSSDDGSDGSNDTLGSFGTEAVANAIAKGGGIGVARQVVAKVTAERLRSES